VKRYVTKINAILLIDVS